MSDYWQEDAACRGMDTNLFYPDEEGNYEHEELAKSICWQCPVRLQCHDAAMSRMQNWNGTDHRDEEEHGIWGGHDEEERRRINRKLHNKERTGSYTTEKGDKP